MNHGRKTYARNQDAVANCNAHGKTSTSLVKRARAYSEDLSLVELLDRRLRQEDAAGSLGLSLDALDEDAVQKRDEGADGANRSGLPRC